jgi:hypothetical protein
VPSIKYYYHEEGKEGGQMGGTRDTSDRDMGFYAMQQLWTGQDTHKALKYFQEDRSIWRVADFFKL